MLCSAEPATFSAADLRLLLKKGQREASRDELMKLIEFISNDAAEDTVDITCRSENKLIAMLCEANVALGRRGRDMPLPADWSEWAVYTYEVKGIKVKVTNKLSGDVRTADCPRLVSMYLDYRGVK